MEVIAKLRLGYHFFGPPGILSGRSIAIDTVYSLKSDCGQVRIAYTSAWNTEQSLPSVRICSVLSVYKMLGPTSPTTSLMSGAIRKRVDVICNVPVISLLDSRFPTRSTEYIFIENISR